MIRRSRRERSEMLYFTQIVGLKILSASGECLGRIQEVALEPAQDRNLVQALVFRRHGASYQVPSRFGNVSLDAVQLVDNHAVAQPFSADGTYLLVKRDVLDQQIIDVNGRKVVRVNDVNFEISRSEGHLVLRAIQVDVGFGGALRRLLQGAVPRKWLASASRWTRSSVIPWNMFNLVEVDPARRVKLEIRYEALNRLHPADVADIVEELAPAEREALFSSLENEVAAEVLGEVEPRFQRSLLKAMDTDKAAEIVEEMEPDEAADVLAELPPETSDEILQEMQPTEREDVSELLEFPEDTAGGRMTTEFIAVPVTATVGDAVNAMRNFGGPVESLNTIFLVDERNRLVASVPLARIVLSASATPLAQLWNEPVSVRDREKDTAITELFDKYNLLTLPVVDAAQRLVGVITADDVIGLLRDRK
jgi:sporulation protein YlmC with PRC-barrel domain/CBS domain-containing protein